MSAAGPANRTFTVLAAGLLAVVSILLLFPRTQETPFHGDESGWISSAIYYTKLLKERDFSRDKWDCARCGAWGDLNPHVGKWLIGLAYLDCVDGEKCSFGGFYQPALSLAENARRGNVPPREVLMRGRLGVAVVGVLCVLVAFLIGRNLGRLRMAGGIAAAALVLTNGLFLQSATRVMTDAHYNLFLLGGCLACLVILTTSGHKYLLALCALAGLMTGLAGSVKVSGFLLGGALFLSVLAYVVVVQRPRVRIVFGSVAIFAFFCLILAYALNPTFWPEINVGPGGALEVSSGARLLNFPTLFRRWNWFIQAQEANGLGHWTGNRLFDINKNMFLRYTSTFREVEVGTASRFLIDGFFCLGLAVCARQVFLSFRNRRPSVLFVPLSWFFINYCFLLAFSRLNWDRYYFSVTIAVLLIASIGIVEVVERLCPTLVSVRDAIIGQAGRRPGR